MAVNYWHRKSGTLKGKPGVYYRYPLNPDFQKLVRGHFLRAQWVVVLRALWVPKEDCPCFEAYGLKQGIGKTCPRCRRDEECKAWPSLMASSSPTPSMEETADAWFKLYDEVCRGGVNIPSGFVNAEPAKSGRASWSEEAPKQDTYGRQVDPDAYTHEFRFWYTPPQRDVLIQHPLDVKIRAAHVLGVAVNADVAVIKRAARRLALVHHPDRGGDVEKMTEVLGARDVLLGRGSRG